MENFFIGFSDELEKLAFKGKGLVEKVLKSQAAPGAGIGGVAGAISDDESAIKGLLRGAVVGGALGKGVPAAMKSKTLAKIKDPEARKAALDKLRKMMGGSKKSGKKIRERIADKKKAKKSPPSPVFV